jgi:hypothetical protein
VFPAAGCRADAPSAGEVALDPDPDGGFVVLAFRPVPFVKPRTFAVFDSAEALRARWRDWEVPGPVPEADFGKYEVLLLAEDEQCSGGLGGAELDQLLLGSEGRVSFQFAPAFDFACEATEGLRRTSLYVVAVARNRLRAATPRFGGTRVSCRNASGRRTPVPTAGPEPAPAASPCTEALPPASPRAGTDSVLQPPARGGVALQYLADGTPVFVVRHPDGSIDVLASDLPSRYEVLADRRLAIAGLAQSLGWNASSARFQGPSGTYDEYGVPVLALAWRSIDLYAWSPGEGGSMVVPRGARHPGHGPRRVAPTRAFACVDARGVARPQVPWANLFVADRVVSLSEARQRPIGTRTTVDADLDLAPGRARLCDSWPTHGWTQCAGATWAALGVAWQPAPPRGFRDSAWIHGPLAGRVAENGLAEVVLFGSGPYYDDVLRPVEWPSIRVKTSVAAIAAAAHDRGGATGVEAAIGARATPWPRASTAERVLGDLALDVRVRWIAPPGAGGSEIFGGLAVFFEQYGPLRSWEYPALATVAVPEVGVGHAGSRTFPYATWTVPIGYRFVSPRLRRHPIDAADVLGVRVAPFVTLPSPASAWIAGATLGVTIW